MTGNSRIADKLKKLISNLEAAAELDRTKIEELANELDDIRDDLENAAGLIGQGWDAL